MRDQSRKLGALISSLNEPHNSLLTTLGVRISFAESIEVLVGPAKKSFRVHPDALQRRSTFFRAACSERWKHASNAIELIEDDPEIFDLYLNCVYTNELDVDATDMMFYSEREQFDLRYHRLACIWILSDKLGDLLTCNMAVNKMIDLSCAIDELPSIEVLKLALDKTSEQSALQHLLLDHWVHESTEWHLKALENDSEVPRHFFVRMLLEHHEMNNKHPHEKLSNLYTSKFVVTRRCRYLQHDTEYHSCGSDCKKDPEGLRG